MFQTWEFFFRTLLILIIHKGLADSHNNQSEGTHYTYSKTGTVLFYCDVVAFFKAKHAKLLTFYKTINTFVLSLN